MLVFLAILGSESRHGSWDGEVFEQGVSLVEEGGGLFGRDEGREDEITIGVELLEEKEEDGSANVIEGYAGG